LKNATINKSTESTEPIVPTVDTTPEVTTTPDSAPVVPTDIFTLPNVRTLAEFLLAEHVARAVCTTAKESNDYLLAYFKSIGESKPKGKREGPAADGALSIARAKVRSLENDIVTAAQAEAYDKLPVITAALKAARQELQSAASVERIAGTLSGLRLSLDGGKPNMSANEHAVSAPGLAKRAAEYTSLVLGELREVKSVDSDVLTSALRNIATLDTLTAQEFVPIAVIGADAHTAYVRYTELAQLKAQATKSVATSEAQLADAVANNAPQSDIDRLEATLAGARGHLASATTECANASFAYEKARDAAKVAYAIAFPNTD
jgi:hypothetical protein